MTTVEYPTLTATSLPSRSSPVLPYTFPVLQPSPLDSWRSISLDEDRHSGHTPLVCFYHLLNIHRPSTSKSKSLLPSPFTLPHTVLYSQQSLPHLSSHPFLTLLDWYHTVPTPSSNPRVVRATRPSLSDTPTRILQAFSSPPAPSPRQSLPAASPSSSGRAAGTLSYQSTYARPPLEWKVAEPIIAQLLSFPSSSTPTLRYLTASDLRSFLGPPSSTQTGADDDARQRLYADLFHRHPHLTFNSDPQSIAESVSLTPAPTCILQAFAYPPSPSPHAELLRVQWKAATSTSPALCLTQRYTSPHSLHDLTLTPQARAATYDYPPTSTPSPALVLRGATAAAVRATCEAVASHILRATDGHLAPALMTLYLRPAASALHLLWCDKLVFAHEVEADSPETPSPRDEAAALSAASAPTTSAPSSAEAPTSVSATPLTTTLLAAVVPPTDVAGIFSPDILSPEGLVAPFLTAVPVYCAQPIDEEEGEVDLGVDIEHIGPEDGWADQVWQVIRARRAREREEIGAYIRAHERPAAPPPMASPQERWRRRSTPATPGGQGVVVPSGSIGKAVAASSWEERGLVHHWQGKGGQAVTDGERKEIWMGQLRGKRAQLEQLTKATSTKPVTKKEAGEVKQGGWRVVGGMGGEQGKRRRVRPLPGLVGEEEGEGCVRCGMAVGEAGVRVRLGWLLGEEGRVRGLVSEWQVRERERKARKRRERRERRRQWRAEVEAKGGDTHREVQEDFAEEEEVEEGREEDAGKAGMPECVRRLFPLMEEVEWELYRDKEELKGVEVDVCRDCGDWCRGPYDPEGGENGGLSSKAGEAEDSE